MSENKEILVTEHSIFLIAKFRCLFCGTENECRQVNIFCTSTLDHCVSCSAAYIINWYLPPKKSTIEMIQPEEEEK